MRRGDPIILCKTMLSSKIIKSKIWELITHFSRLCVLLNVSTDLTAVFCIVSGKLTLLDVLGHDHFHKNMISSFRVTFSKMAP